MIEVPFRANQSTDIYPQHFDPLWIFALTADHSREKLLWVLRAALIYGYKYKYLEGNLTTFCLVNQSGRILPRVHDLLNHRTFAQVYSNSHKFPLVEQSSHPIQNLYPHSLHTTIVPEDTCFLVGQYRSIQR